MSVRFARHRCLICRHRHILRGCQWGNAAQRAEFIAAMESLLARLDERGVAVKALRGRLDELRAQRGNTTFPVDISWADEE